MRKTAPPHSARVRSSTARPRRSAGSGASWFRRSIAALSLFFFFSSRRRHTRFDCDWSSDVCSSDLDPPPAPASPADVLATLEGLADPTNPNLAAAIDDLKNGIALLASADMAATPFERSEERRVGKECRTWRAPEPSKNKKSKKVRAL